METTTEQIMQQANEPKIMPLKTVIIDSSQIMAIGLTDNEFLTNSALYGYKEISKNQINYKLDEKNKPKKLFIEATDKTFFPYSYFAVAEKTADLWNIENDLKYFYKLGAPLIIAVDGASNIEGKLTVFAIAPMILEGD